MSPRLAAAIKELDAAIEAEVQARLEGKKPERDMMASVMAWLWLRDHNLTDKEPSWRWSRVYFIEAPDVRRIKIGVSQRLDDRLSTLKTSSPTPLAILGVIVGEEADEQRLHGRFRRHQTHGEWFDSAIKPEVMQIIAEWAPLVERVEELRP